MRVADPTDSVQALLGLDGVADAVEQARAACTRLRWHEALRRRMPEAAAESRLRGARASAALDGAALPMALVRDRARGAAPWPPRPDPVDTVVAAALAVTTETEHVRTLVRSAPAQALARLHVAAATGLVPADQVGRPRLGRDECGEFVDLGPAPAPDHLARRLADLGELIRRDGPPVALVAALAHAEVCVARPFVRGNGLVARALERVLLVAGGLDPTGVAVPEEGYLQTGPTAYLGALTAYAQGGPPGVALWLRHAARAYVDGAAHGESICRSVLAGRLG